jgi:uncharacterized protein (DUF2237 family)
VLSPGSERREHPSDLRRGDRGVLEHQRVIGNDLSTPRPEYGFPGLVPGDRWCVTAPNWVRAYEDGSPSFVVLASTSARALEWVPLAALQEHAVDVPADPGQIAD